MKTKSIYSQSNRLQLKEVLDKYNHKGCVVNFFGDIVTPAFEFANNSHGVNFGKT